MALRDCMRLLFSNWCGRQLDKQAPLPVSGILASWLHCEGITDQIALVRLGRNGHIVTCLGRQGEQVTVQVFFRYYFKLPGKAILTGPARGTENCGLAGAAEIQDRTHCVRPNYFTRNRSIQGKRFLGGKYGYDLCLGGGTENIG